MQENGDPTRERRKGVPRTEAGLGRDTVGETGVGEWKEGSRGEKRPLESLMHLITRKMVFRRGFQLGERVQQKL